MSAPMVTMSKRGNGDSSVDIYISRKSNHPHRGPLGLANWCPSKPDATIAPTVSRGPAERPAQLNLLGSLSHLPSDRD